MRCLNNERHELTPKMGQYLEERKRPCEKRRDVITDGEQVVRMKRLKGRKTR